MAVSSATRGAAMVAGHEQAPAVHLRCQDGRLAARRGADVQHPVARPRAGPRAPRAATLLPARRARRATRRRDGRAHRRAGAPRPRHGPPARPRRRLPRQAFDQRRPGTAVGRTNDELRRLVVELAPALRGLESVAREPPVGEPFRMREGDGQVLQRAVAVAAPGRAVAAGGRSGGGRAIAARR